MSVEFWSVQVKSGTEVTVRPPEEYLINITQAAVTGTGNSAVVFLNTTSIEGEPVKCVLGTLRPNKVDQFPLNIIIGNEVDTVFSVTGDSSLTVYLSGYFQPAPGSEDAEGDDEEDDEDDEEDEEDEGEANSEQLKKLINQIKSRAGNDEDDDSEEDDEEEEEEDDSEEEDEEEEEDDDSEEEEEEAPPAKIQKVEKSVPTPQGNKQQPNKGTPQQSKGFDSKPQQQGFKSPNNNNNNNNNKPKTPQSGNKFNSPQNNRPNTPQSGNKPNFNKNNHNQSGQKRHRN